MGGDRSLRRERGAIFGGGWPRAIDVRPHVMEVRGRRARYFADALAFLIVGIGLGSRASHGLRHAIQGVVSQAGDRSAGSRAIRCGARDRAAAAFQQLIRRIVHIDGGRRHRRADGAGFQVIQRIVSVGLILGRIQRHGLLHRQQPIQGIEGIRMGQRRAADVAGLLASVSKDVIRIIVLADDGGRQRPIDRLGEGVVGEVGIAAIHAVRQPFLFQSATGVVQIVGLISFAIGDFIQQAAGAVASIQVLPLEVIVERSPSPLNFCLEAHGRMRDGLTGSIHAASRAFTYAITPMYV